jgi:hypothetical protein
MHECILTSVTPAILISVTHGRIPISVWHSSFKGLPQPLNTRLCSGTPSLDLHTCLCDASNFTNGRKLTTQALVQTDSTTCEQYNFKQREDPQRGMCSCTHVHCSNHLNTVLPGLSGVMGTWTWCQVSDVVWICRANALHM